MLRVADTQSMLDLTAALMQTADFFSPLMYKYLCPLHKIICCVGRYKVPYQNTVIRVFPLNNGREAE